MNSLQRFAFPIFAALMLALPVLPLPDFWITQLNSIGLYAIVALGLVLLTGVAGLTSFGQAAFVGVGAYTAAFLAAKMGVSPWLTLFIGIALSVAVALVLGSITLRMSGHYLPLATIAWGLALNYTMANMDFLGKYDGLMGVPPITVFGVALNDGKGMYLLIWAFALAAALAALHLLDSRPGRAIRALKSGTTMAEAMGISTFRYKLVVFVLAAILAAISGWLYAHFQRTVNLGIAQGLGHVFDTALEARVGSGLFYGFRYRLCAVCGIYRRNHWRCRFGRLRARHPHKTTGNHQQNNDQAYRRFTLHYYYLQHAWARCWPGYLYNYQTHVPANPCRRPVYADRGFSRGNKKGGALKQPPFYSRSRPPLSVIYCQTPSFRPYKPATFRRLAC